MVKQALIFVACSQILIRDLICLTVCMKMQKHLERKINIMHFPGVQFMGMQNYLSVYLPSPLCPGEYAGSNTSLSKAVKQIQLF